MSCYCQRLIATAILPICVLLCGFRPIDTRQSAEQRVRKSEARFNVGEHMELYHFVRIDRNNRVEQGRMLLAFRYEEAAVYGVFRQLPEGDRRGVTLLNHQYIGRLPKLYLHDPAKPYTGAIPMRGIWQKFGDTDWFLESIFDDDKNPWSYTQLGRQTLYGKPHTIIEATYASPVLRDAVPYTKRRFLLDSATQYPSLSEFYASDGTLLFSISLLEVETFEIDQATQRRTSRLQLIDWQNRSTTVLMRVASTFDQTLPDSMFEVDRIANWDEALDEQLLALLGEDSSLN